MLFSNPVWTWFWGASCGPPAAPWASEPTKRKNGCWYGLYFQLQVFWGSSEAIIYLGSMTQNKWMSMCGSYHVIWSFFKRLIMTPLNIEHNITKLVVRKRIWPQILNVTLLPRWHPLRPHTVSTSVFAKISLGWLLSLTWDTKSRLLCESPVFVWPIRQLPSLSI